MGERKTLGEWLDTPPPSQVRLERWLKRKPATFRIVVFVAIGLAIGLLVTLLTGDAWIVAFLALMATLTAAGPIAREHEAMRHEIVRLRKRLAEHEPRR